MTESIQDMFRILGSKLKGKDKIYLDKIEEEYYKSKGILDKAHDIFEDGYIRQKIEKIIMEDKDYEDNKNWMGTSEVFEEFYRMDQEEKEEQLEEILESNKIIERLKRDLERQKGDKKEIREMKKVIQKNEKRIANLKNIIKKYKNDREDINKTKRSYAGRIRWANQWYDEVLSALEEIYECCENKRLRNIDNFKARIQKICEEHLEFCSKCENLKSDCVCKT